jgi:hypothetical protein
MTITNFNEYIAGGWQSGTSIALFYQKPYYRD